MNLLVDIGNSRLKWAQQTAGGLMHPGAVSKDTAVLASLLDDHWRDLPAPEQLLVSNVAGPAVADEIAGWAQGRWGLRPHFASTSRSACGISNAYREPAQLGVDRWLAVIGGWQKYGGPVCIVDCGTALTIDAVAEDGRHLGGMIMPGLSLMRDSLRQAPGIRMPAGTSGFSGLADNTADAVSAGCATALVAAVERTIHSLREQLGEGLKCLVTGGDAGHLLPALSAEKTGFAIRHEPHIVLEGLAAAYEGCRT